MILFLNASPNRDGNTARMVHELIGGRDYEQLDLTDYKVYGYGQDFADDQFDEVLALL